MAENTPVSRKMLGNTTEELASLKGKAKQIIVDTIKKTAVVMDGVTLGGHPLAKAGTKIKSGSEDVIINEGTEATLAADVTIKNKPWSVVLDGEFPTEEEELNALADQVPVGGRVVGLAPLGPEDAIPAPYNTEEIITESGTWTAPMTGWYDVTVVNGGSAGSVAAVNATTAFANGGFGGARDTKLMYLEAGESVPVIIGTGGITDGEGGGITIFNDVSPSIYRVVPPSRSIQIYPAAEAKINRLVGLGGGIGATSNYATKNMDGAWYGAGGGAVWTPTESYFGKGATGAVIIRYYDPRKDTSLSIGDQLVTDLYARLAALEAKVNELEGE